MITKRKTQDKVEIVGKHKHLQIRFANQIIENGNVISQSYERDTVTCGDYTKADVLGVRAIADAVWSQTLIDEYNVSLAENI